MPSEMPPEEKLLPLETAAAALGISDRQLRNLRNDLEALTGKELTRSVKEDGRRVLKIPSGNLEILKAFRNRKSDEEFLLAYAPDRLSGRPTEDWSEVARDVQAGNSPEFIEAEFVGEEITALVPAQQAQIVGRSSEIDALLFSLVKAELQLKVNADAQQEAELEQIEEDSRVQYLRKKAAQLKGEMRAAQDLKAAQEAAEAALQPQPQPGRKRKPTPK